MSSAAEIRRLRGKLLRLERNICPNPDCEEVLIYHRVCPHCRTVLPREYECQRTEFNRRMAKTGVKEQSKNESEKFDLDGFALPLLQTLESITAND